MGARRRDWRRAGDSFWAEAGVLPVMVNARGCVLYLLAISRKSETRVGHMVKKCAALIAVLTLGACSAQGGLSPEQRAIKSTCVAGDYSACSDLGHQMAAQRRGF